MKDERLELTLQNSDPSTAKALQMKVNQVIASHVPIKTNGQNLLHQLTLRIIVWKHQLYVWK